MKVKALLGVTGGIAAYKSPELVRLLIKQGIDVQVVMTRAARAFVTPLTLATVSERPVYDDMWRDPYNPSIEHISLADNADLAIIAPATANIIGKLASGIADDLLTTVFMALTCPVVICPSMNVNMFNNRVTQDNLKRLEQLGFQIMAPESGFLACGWTGAGRMPEPANIVEKILTVINSGDMEGINVLVTAGPTEEPLDPVRYLTNRSSGKMGCAIANRAKARGANVTLVSGPLKTQAPDGIKCIKIRTASEMRDRVMELFHNHHIIIKAAAVADYRPETIADNKIKKTGEPVSINLVQNPDILKEVGKMKRDDQVLVGFAAETNNALENAKKKLMEKNADMLVLNDVSKPGAGFDYDTNIVRLLFRDREDEQYEIMAKEKIADIILDRIMELKQTVK